MTGKHGNMDIGNRRWTATCHDARDGSGDLVVDLPSDFMIEAGLSIGDEFSVEIVGESIVLTRLRRCSM